MSISKFVLWTAGLVVTSAISPAQFVTEAEEQKARELLRQQIAAYRVQRSVAYVHAAAPSHAYVPSAMTGAEEQRAREMIRQRIAESRANAAQGRIGILAPVRLPDDTTVASAASTASMEEPSGPRTKQQRLLDLLQRYKADQIDPYQYHEQRAEILAEP